MAMQVTDAESQPYPIGEAERATFDAQGFIRLPDVLSAETIAAYEPEITAKVIERNTMHLPMEERSTYAKAFLQVENLWRHSDRVRELVFSSHLARIAAELLGVEGVRLYHDQALYKEAGGGLTPWHADQYYWPLSTDRVCTVWIPLQETPEEMGPMEFAVGSHRLDLGRTLGISDESEAQIAASVARRELPVAGGGFALGEVSYHLGWTFHHTAPNVSPTPRRVMTIIYMDADITVTEPINDNQRADLNTWMPGTAIGAKPATALNPLLYHR